MLASSLLLRCGAARRPGQWLRAIHRSAARRGGDAITPSLAGIQLKEWLAEAGGTSHPGLEVVSATGGSQHGTRGLTLALTAPVLPGERLVGLPRAAILSAPFTDGPALVRLCHAVPPELWPVSLGLVLLSERAKGPRSKFAPYVRLLPSVHNGIPIFFGRDAVEALQYAPIQAQLAKRCRFMADFAAGPLLGVTAPFQGQTADANALGWGLAMASSRAFGLNGPAKPRSMLPLIDMANHSFDHNAKVLPAPDGDGVVMVATQPIAANDEVTISYGNVQSDDLLLDYGFVIPDNPFETVAVRFDPMLIELGKEIGGVAPGSVSDSTAATQPWKAELLQRLGLGLHSPDADADASIELHYGVPVGDGSGIDPKMIGALRVLFSGSADCVTVAGRTDAQLCDPALPAAPHYVVEQAVYRTSMGIVAMVLSSFPTTIDEDVALLAQLGAAGPMDMRLAVEFRLGKKRVLRKAIEGHKRALAKLIEAESE